MPWHPAVTDRDAILAAIAQSKNVRSALELLGIPYNQRSRDLFAMACRNFGIDDPFPERFSTKKMPDDEVFIENSPYVCNSATLKRRYIAATGVPERCAICDQDTTWNGQPLMLQLDHENGVNNDHRLENLRLLCPNCHTQTPTYAGKRRQALPRFVCQAPDCGQEFTSPRSRPSRRPRFCSISCSNRYRYRVQDAA